MLAFGSFGVPVKSKVAKSLNIDPLVMQSYKTGMCFITSVLFLFFRGEKFTFTPWGIVSGLFWVPGGVATIYAIKTAGLATAMGVGSSSIVLVSFSWGIFFFDEHVHSQLQACSAVACMLCGLAGMAYYSAPAVAHHQTFSNGVGTGRHSIDAYYQPVRPEDADFLPPEDDDVMDYVAMESTNNETYDEERSGGEEQENIDGSSENNINNPRASNDTDDNDVMAVAREGNSYNHHDGATSQSLTSPPVSLCWGRVRLQERVLGILATFIFTGLWGGSMMVPMEFAPNVDKGLPFLTSFAIGAAVVTLFLWCIRFLYLCYQNDYSLKRGYQALPSFHLRHMWLYGMLCGLLWSVGNFCSILSVEFLGEGVGYSVIQASLLVSGLWGVFYFREIEGADAITKWYVAASVTVTGILLLGYEHHEP